MRYVDVENDAAELSAMLTLSKVRLVPVIVDAGKVAIGYGGS